MDNEEIERHYQEWLTRMGITHEEAMEAHGYDMEPMAEIIQIDQGTIA